MSSLSPPVSENDFVVADDPIVASEAVTPVPDAVDALPLKLVPVPLSS